MSAKHVHMHSYETGHTKTHARMMTMSAWPSEVLATVSAWQVLVVLPCTLAVHVTGTRVAADLLSRRWVPCGTSPVETVGHCCGMHTMPSHSMAWKRRYMNGSAGAVRLYMLLM